MLFFEMLDFQQGYARRACLSTVAEKKKSSGVTFFEVNAGNLEQQKLPTPQKTNMTVENPNLKMYFLLNIGIFPMSC